MHSQSHAVQRSAPQQDSAFYKEFSIRLPKNVAKTYHVMHFNGNLNVHFEKWTRAKMDRENNMKEHNSVEKDEPKFGADSEYGAEARRKKLGIVPKKYNANNQPWLLDAATADGTKSKKFKSIRDGGVSSNAAYYVLTHADDGTIEAYPLREWYRFQPILRYNTLSAEEAEEEFSKCSNVWNHFSVMMKKRLKVDEEIDMEDEEMTKNRRHLQISDMDSWIDGSDDDSAEEVKEDDDDDEVFDLKNKKTLKKKGQKKRNTDVEAFEDSDDGDEEGRERDYISDSSDSGSEDTNLEGVAEEKALRKLLNSDEETNSDSDETLIGSDSSSDEDDESPDMVDIKVVNGKKLTDIPDGKKRRRKEDTCDALMEPHVKKPKLKRADKKRKRKEVTSDSPSVKKSKLTNESRINEDAVIRLRSLFSLSET